MVVDPAPKDVGCGADNLLSAKPQLVTEDRNAPATCTRGTTVTSLEPSELQPSNDSTGRLRKERLKRSRPQDT